MIAAHLSVGQEMHEPTGQPMHDEDQRAKMKEYARWSSFSAANPLLFQE